MADRMKALMNAAVDHGGMDCTCCNHYTGAKKPRLNRLARRQLKQQDRKELDG